MLERAGLAPNCNPPLVSLSRQMLSDCVVY
jgi:hypothetical protein